MKYLLLVFVFVSLLAGCAGTAQSENVPQETTRQALQHNPETSTGPTLTQAQSLPPTAEAADTEVGKAPLAKTVRPPKIPVAPVDATPQLADNGLQTYTRTDLGLAVDFPQQWTVTKDGTGATFTAPEGALILLQPAEQDAGTALNGTCSQVINSQGLPVELCFDAASKTYLAVFRKDTGSATPWVMLSTVSSEEPSVFFEMIDLLRLDL